MGMSGPPKKGGHNYNGAQCYEGQGPELRGSVMNAEMKP